MWVVSVEIAIYSLMTVLIIYMIYKLLIKYRYFREVHLTLFYALAFLVVTTRIAYFVLDLNYFRDVKAHKFQYLVHFPVVATKHLNNINIWFKFMLGLTQLYKFYTIRLEIELFVSTDEDQGRGLKLQLCIIKIVIAVLAVIETGFITWLLVIDSLPFNETAKWFTVYGLS